MADDTPFLRIDTVIVRVRDLTRSLAWYRTLLGAEPACFEGGDGLAVLPLGPGSLTLWQSTAHEPHAGELRRRGTYPILAVDDADAAHAFVQRHGGQPDPVGHGPCVRYFGFTDPDGNYLEACQIL